MDVRHRLNSQVGFRRDPSDAKPVLTPKQLADQAHTERIRETREAEINFAVPFNLKK
ncbi:MULTISPECIES: hypothetical protein [unclassified Caballeronia]|uniref:hypothetical protein n=1 Tax=unclassified Caballeronia TaxID=2646786 RepID=UPI00285E55F1|nr:MULTISPECIES: hypothetical protein [unclassified Caballeronia]MDR5771802.1 hypothetical protein [Caballeronia sp. LZ002]MDR5847237.1 hypothetical protein [Caballeronia sp. LZ003]